MRHRAAAVAGVIGVLAVLIITGSAYVNGATNNVATPPAFLIIPTVIIAAGVSGSLAAWRRQSSARWLFAIATLGCVLAWPYLLGVPFFGAAAVLGWTAGERASAR